MSNPFFQTINGFDVAILLFLGVAVLWAWFASVDADKWERIARHYETQYSASEELARDLNRWNDELFVQCGDAREELRHVEAERDLMAKYLDKKCFCSKAHSQMRCLFHDFVRDENRRQIDPWSPSPWCDGKNTENCDLTCDNPVQHEFVLRYPDHL